MTRLREMALRVKFTCDGEISTGGLVIHFSIPTMPKRALEPEDDTNVTKKVKGNIPYALRLFGLRLSGRKRA
jgi:hypothetical protein